MEQVASDRQDEPVGSVQTHLLELSKTIADVLCKSHKKKVPKDVHVRALETLRSLRSGSSETHFSIGRANYDCYLSTLCHGSESGDDGLNLEACALPEVQAGTDVALYYKKLAALNGDRHRYLSIIRERDRRKCNEKSQFSTENLTPPKPNENFPQIKFPRHDSARVAKSTDTERSRNLDVSLGYSISNLSPAELDHKRVLSNIFSKLSSYPFLYTFEVDFIKYLRRNSAGQAKLLEEFSFLYEQPLIRFCTEFLLKDAPVPDELKDLLEVCSSSPKLKTAITSLTYELFSLSNYNRRFGKIFKILEWYGIT